MARYRKVDSRIWNDEKFREFSDDGKLVFLFVLTHPHMTGLGAMRGTLPGLAAELGWKLRRFHRAFEESRKRGMAEYEPEVGIVALPNFLSYNAPESPNVVRSWLGAFDLLPECSMKQTVAQRAADFVASLPAGFKDALPELFRKSMPNPKPYPEQEQEPEPEEEKKSGSVDTPTDAFSPPFGSERFLAALASWLKHRAEKSKPIRPDSEAWRRQRKAIEDMGEARAIAAIAHSVANDYQGLYEPQQASDNGRPRRTPSRHAPRVQVQADSADYDADIFRKEPT